MVDQNSSLLSIKALINKCLDQLYVSDALLFTRNGGEGLSERCLVFRFAYYLQMELQDFIVDCDYNSSFAGVPDSQGYIIGGERSGKPIENEDGTTTKRFVDIIVHKRTNYVASDFICFEMKKWNNAAREQKLKDENNLKKLTLDYSYKYGFHLVLGKTRERTKVSVFQNGMIIEAS